MSGSPDINQKCKVDRDEGEKVVSNQIMSNLANYSSKEIIDKANLDLNLIISDLPFLAEVGNEVKFSKKKRILFVWPNLGLLDKVKFLRQFPALTSFKRPLLASVLAISLLTFQIYPESIKPAKAAVVNSTLGKEFWITFDTNANTPNLYIFLSGPNNANVTITWPDATTESYSITANQITTVNATSKMRPLLNTGTESTTFSAAKIVSDVDITVYGLNNATATSDAFVSIPTTSLGTEYRALTYKTSISGLNARLSVIAVETGTTTITITPKNNIAASHNAGVAYTKTLTQGQVYSVESLAAPGSEITGTLVTSDKKIAVFSGIACVNIVSGACDLIIEQMPPVTSWGKDFILPGSSNLVNKDKYRVLAHEDGTVVTLNGSNQNLNAGDYYEFDSTGTSGLAVDLLTSNKSVLVSQFIGGGNYSNTPLTTPAVTRTGDPAALLMVPTLQFLKQYTVATPATGFDVNSITVVVKKSEKTTITLNGSTLSSSYFTDITSSDYAIGRIPVASGSYSLTSTSGFGVYTYGFNSADSYAYPGGYAIVDLVANPGGVEDIESGSSGGAPVPTPIVEVISDPEAAKYVPPTSELPSGKIETKNNYSVEDIKKVLSDGLTKEQISILNQSGLELLSDKDFTKAIVTQVDLANTNGMVDQVIEIPVLQTLVINAIGLSPNSIATGYTRLPDGTWYQIGQQLITDNGQIYVRPSRFLKVGTYVLALTFTEGGMKASKIIGAEASNNAIDLDTSNLSPVSPIWGQLTIRMTINVVPEKIVIPFGVLSSDLDKSSKKLLKSVTPWLATTKKIKVTGYVQPNSNTSNDSSLSKSRANAVVAELRKFGVDVEFEIVAGKRKMPKACKEYLYKCTIINVVE